MWNKPTEIQLRKLPEFYSTEDISLKEKMILAHFFIGGSDWYVAEYSPEERIFFGFAILNSDYEMAEWGYFSFKELCELKMSFLEVDRDLHFRPTKAKDIENIRKARGW